MRQWKKTLKENPGTDILEAEKIAYHDLKPKYLSDFISRYKNLTELSIALQKDQASRRITGTAKRLRDERRL